MNASKFPSPLKLTMLLLVIALTMTSFIPAAGSKVIAQPLPAAPGTQAFSQGLKIYMPLVTSPGSQVETYFRTLPPGSHLPSDTECAAAIKRRPENKAVNRSFNSAPGSQRLPADFFGSAVDPRANSVFAARVTGSYTGTTDEILQWAACKWGIDEDIVRAQAAIESWWRQTTQGDWTTDSSRCAPGHGLGADGIAGWCPESFGLLQNRYPYEQAAWPGIYSSSSFNADTAYAYWRSCYEGYEWWLNNVDRGWDYKEGDVWGCLGRWYSGRWHTQAAETYIQRVREYYDARIWEAPDFQEP